MIHALSDFFAPLRWPVLATGAAAVPIPWLPAEHLDAYSVIAAVLVILFSIRWFFRDHEAREFERNASVARAVLAELGISGNTLADVKAELRVEIREAKGIALKAVEQVQDVAGRTEDIAAKVQRIEAIEPIAAALRLRG